MARRSIAESKAPDKSRLLSTRVTTVPLSSRELFVVQEDAPLWDFARRNRARLSEATIPNAKGAIVRLEPPAWAEDGDVAALKLALERCGAAAVRAMPRRVGAVVVQEEVRQARPAEGARAAAMALVEEAHTTDREALRDAVEQALVAGGL
jgi:hypothetical protein